MSVFNRVALRFARRLTVGTEHTSPAVHTLLSITNIPPFSCQHHHRYRRLTSDACDSSPSTNYAGHKFNSPISRSASTRDNDDDDVVLPPPPTDCCMSGCARCVWLLYADELASIYRDGGKAAEKVLDAIDDPSLKIFLSLELREKLQS